MAIVNLPSFMSAVKNRPLTFEMSLWNTASCLFVITFGHQEEKRVEPNHAEEHRRVEVLHYFNDVQLVFF